MSKYELEKSIWTDLDFDVMGWHDCRVHAIAFNPEKYELMFDVDYILEWVEDDESRYKFLIAPATLVFFNVHSGEISADLTAGVTILDITRGSSRPVGNPEHAGNAEELLWTFECIDCDLSFWSVGYTQFIRQVPMLVSDQHLDHEERGGISFSREAAAQP